MMSSLTVLLHCTKASLSTMPDIQQRSRHVYLGSKSYCINWGLLPGKYAQNSNPNNIIFSSWLILRSCFLYPCADSHPYNDLNQVTPFSLHATEVRDFYLTGKEATWLKYSGPPEYSEDEKL